MLTGPTTSKATAARRRCTVLLAVALLSLVGVAGCGSGSTEQSFQPAVEASGPSGAPDPQKATPDGATAPGKGAPYSMVLHITNNSAQSLNFKSDQFNARISPPPKPRLAPGDTDTLYVTAGASGLETDLVYVADGATYVSEGKFEVPPIVSNSAGCLTFDRSIRFSQCDIAGGYHPNAHWTFSN